VNALELVNAHLPAQLMAWYHNQLLSAQVKPGGKGDAELVADRTANMNTSGTQSSWEIRRGNQRIRS
jgi:hypothetical protein